jgi:hypothetical protein
MSGEEKARDPKKPALTIQFGEINEANLEQFRILNRAILPVRRFLLPLATTARTPTRTLQTLRPPTRVLSLASLFRSLASLLRSHTTGYHETFYQNILKFPKSIAKFGT